ncbi:nephrin-like [Agrilus planipennis]|uniref:Nephrin-like n=1 Tax=Agrilus planipennis TaxID=224129 RepID=A0A1W4WV37_AGRPL|nr:nephrin-like [Agrilus planipennis]
MKRYKCTFVVLLVSFAVLSVFSASPLDEDVEVELVLTREGNTSELPCNLQVTHPPDKVSLVEWTKGDDEQPLYKVDFRGVQTQVVPKPEGENRLSLRLVEDKKALLVISSTKVADEGLYNCRVDFYRSQTTFTHVNLTVIVPPQGVQITDELGIPIKNGVTKAYAAGASLILICVATGGKPLPTVAWSRDGEIVTNVTQHFPERFRSQNILRVPELTRSDLHAVYQCEVSNSNQQPPLIVKVTVEMFLRPLEVTLIDPFRFNQTFSAEKKYELICRCKGSRPPPIISWWKDGIPMEGGTISVSADGNTTTSTLWFTPQASDDGLVLSCRAANQMVPHSELRDSWMLKVLYPPKIILHLGHGLQPSSIREGVDVYFECQIIANPKVTRVWWLRDGIRLASNASAGILVANQTLVLQGVSRRSSGNYYCESSNTEGTSRSVPFQLKVKFEPVCGEPNNRKVLGVAKGEPVKIECKVDAEPAARYFRWSFNSTPGISRILKEHTANAGLSILTYQPMSASDYGTIQCWGNNEFGTQRAPCIYHIVPAGRPDPPNGCVVANITHHNANITCVKGFDGGLKQKFIMLVKVGDTEITNITSASTDFEVGNLDAATEYTFVVFALNAKGWSKSGSTLMARTLAAPGLKELRRSTVQSKETKLKGPWMYILLAGGSTLIVAGSIAIIIFVVRRFKVDSPVRERRRSPKRNELSLGPSIQGFTDAGTDDKNPDLIPPPANEALLTAGLIPTAPYTITTRPSQKRNCATQMPVKPYHVTWAPILQSRNCATQTPPPHKESSV